MYPVIHILGVYICVYIFKKQVHCKKLELNLLRQHDILLAEEVLFMDTCYGCYGNKAAVSGVVRGAVQGRRRPPRAAPPASPHPSWSTQLKHVNLAFNAVWGLFGSCRKSGMSCVRVGFVYIHTSEIGNFMCSPGIHLHLLFVTSPSTTNSKICDNSPLCSFSSILAFLTLCSTQIFSFWQPLLNFLFLCILAFYSPSFWKTLSQNAIAPTWVLTLGPPDLQARISIALVRAT